MNNFTPKQSRRWRAIVWAEDHWTQWNFRFHEPESRSAMSRDIHQITSESQGEFIQAVQAAIGQLALEPNAKS